MGHLSKKQIRTLEEIARLIRIGCIESNSPNFNLKASEEVWGDTECMQHIAHLVSQGYTEGYHPRWELKSSEDDLKDLL